GGVTFTRRRRGQSWRAGVGTTARAVAVEFRDHPRPRYGPDGDGRTHVLPLGHFRLLGQQAEDQTHQMGKVRLAPTGERLPRMPVASWATYAESDCCASSEPAYPAVRGLAVIASPEFTLRGSFPARRGIGGWMLPLIARGSQGSARTDRRRR